MATTPVHLDSAIDQMARTIMQAFDKNGDGQLGSDEFSAFLGKLLGSDGLAGLSGSGGVLASGGGTGSGGIGSATMEGFDFRKMDDPSVTTVKYKFARVARNYGLGGVTDMNSAEALLRSMTADLKSAGITVLEVSKDKIKVLDDAGQATWVDVIRGAGATSPAWQWLDLRG